MIRINKTMVALIVIGGLVITLYFYVNAFNNMKKEKARVESNLTALSKQYKTKEGQLITTSEVLTVKVKELKAAYKKSKKDSASLSDYEKKLLLAYNENKKLNSKLNYLQSLSNNQITVNDTIYVPGGCNGLRYTDKHLEIAIDELPEGTKIGYRYIASTTQEIVLNRANKWIIGRWFNPKFKVEVLNAIDDPKAEISNSYHFVIKK